MFCTGGAQRIEMSTTLGTHERAQTIKVPTVPAMAATIGHPQFVERTLHDQVPHASRREAWGTRALGLRENAARGRMAPDYYFVIPSRFNIRSSS